MRRHLCIGVRLTWRRRLVFPLILALWWVAPAHATIIISEYVEGSGTNQAIELYNYGSTAIDITGWTIDIYLNGSTVVDRSITLSDTILPGDIFVLARTNSDPAILAVADQVISVPASRDDLSVLP